MVSDKIVVYKFLKSNAKKKTLVEYLVFLETGLASAAIETYDEDMHVLWNSLKPSEQLLVIHKISYYFMGK